MRNHKQVFQDNGKKRENMRKRYHSNKGEIHYHKENKTNGVNRLNSVQKATNLKKNQKWE